MKSLQDLPCDAFMDILSRLGSKDVCRYRCVSKHWLTTISHPFFKKLHRNRSKRTPKLLLSTDSYNFDLTCSADLTVLAISHQIPPNQFSFNIIGDIYNLQFGNDLVCVLDETAVFVCNPSIHQVIRLPDFRNRPSCVVGVALGFVPSRNEYEIVCFVDPCDDDDDDDDDDESGDDDRVVEIEIEVEAFTLRDGGPNSGSWRKISTYPRMRSSGVSLNGKLYPSINRNWGFGVSVNGTIYWLLNERVGGEGKILSLDLETEEFTTICCPEDYLSLPSEGYMVEMKGTLCLTTYSQEDLTMSVWMLKDSETHYWFKEYVIDLRGMGGYCKALGYVPWDDDVGEILIWSSEERILLYSIRNNRIERVDNLIVPELELQCSYFDSLFSLESR